ncbi:MAG: DNA primase [Candidatus Pacebacteria bacterium]|nr:DNA primase [Candidatus Paceibacterota bacterium]MDD3072799.1 DNA primase [Candidatus Paceibacterota bacterium]MDD3729305.1 DNA primase [Candidatus Paceibacterota bacterium]MDD4467008.1 DNA primase [Candidatus Paceibacterota bacterium]MDD5446193.1 DNA primase [Candidatus Paceibacterota bacterium]
MLNSPTEEIKSRLDIVNVIGSYIKLQKTGANYRAICPFHSEKSPSFFVSPSKQIWHCFGSCGIGGDIFGFVMKIEGVEFKDALKILADKAGVELKKEDPKISTKRQKTYDICEFACSFFEKQMESNAGIEVKKYLNQRGVKEETIKEWRLGYSPDSWRALSDYLIGKGYKREEIEQSGLALISEKNKFYDRFRGRIMFPVFDINSRVIGFGGRVFKDKEGLGAKYINTPSTIIYDKSQTLYGINNAGIEMRKKDSCILVEGYMDAIMAFQSGFKNVVAVSGTALTPLQLKIIKRYTENLHTAFDMDNAGNSATKRGIGLAQSLGFNIKIILMKEGFDPADILAKDKKEWEEMVKGAKSIKDFYFETALSSFDKNTLEGKKSISKEILPVIKRIPNKVEQELWLKDLSGLLEVRIESLMEELLKINEELDFSLEKEEDKKDNNEKEKKTKKDILEEYLICLFLRKPEMLSIVKDEDFLFLTPKTSDILKILKEDPKKINMLENQNITALLIKSEFEEINEGIDREIEKCFGEIKKDFYKKELQNITLRIKKEEENKNEDKIEELKNDFNNFLKIFNQL